MAFSNYRLRAAVLAAPLAVGLAFAGATAAHATYENDPRAFLHVSGDNAKTCEDASLGGELIAEVDGEGGDDTSNFVVSPEENEGGELNEDQYLTLTAKPGVTVTGIVVKGGNGFNVYVPGEKDLEENPGPWEELHAPPNDGGNIPQISHWYACGEAKDVVETPTPTTTTPEAPTTTVETTTPQQSETSTSPVETTESSTQESSSSAAPTTTSTTEAPAIANASDEGDLATTGFGGSWLVWAGALFVLVGAASFAGMRVLKRN